MKKFSYLPNWQYEDALGGRVAGVDEAGRGPLAGPVVACAVILDRTQMPSGINDSKSLSAAKRQHIFNQILNTASVGIGIAEPYEIEMKNILWASLAAMERALADLPLLPEHALIDGNKKPNTPIPCQTLVKGDQKSLSIAAASIIAKVTRDRLMAHADKIYPSFGFGGHKGYPTKAHKHALSTHGPCPIHRRNFAPVAAALTSVNKKLKS